MHLNCNQDLHLKIEALFASCFKQSYNTILQGGADEPLYQPSADDISPHIIYYRDDFVSSAFHELAHWCIAGEFRRTQIDYGYWYAPDGRTKDEQALFEKFEVKPQAIEWAFSQTVDINFRVSIDNLSATLSDSARLTQERQFTEKVQEQRRHYCKFGFPTRANMFLKALQNFAKRNISDVSIQ